MDQDGHIMDTLGSVYRVLLVVAVAAVESPWAFEGNTPTSAQKKRNGKR